jgi:hypothetical protein
MLEPYNNPFWGFSYGVNNSAQAIRLGIMTKNSDLPKFAPLSHELRLDQTKLKTVVKADWVIVGPIGLRALSQN